MASRRWPLLGILSAILGCSMPGHAAVPAVPGDAVATILYAFADHNIVALGEGGHGNVNGYRFRCQLIRDPRAAGVINDIVVESGNSRYQSLMDRFVAGKSVDRNEFRHVWQDTTQPYTVWDGPIYDGFFDVVRDTPTCRQGSASGFCWAIRPSIGKRLVLRRMSFVGLTNATNMQRASYKSRYWRVLEKRC